MGVVERVGLAQKNLFYALILACLKLNVIKYGKLCAGY